MELIQKKMAVQLLLGLGFGLSVMNVQAQSASTPSSAVPQTTSSEVYGGMGGNLGYGIVLGYAKPMSASWTVRGEFAGGLGVEMSKSEDGVNYNGKFTNNRVGAFADWFPFEGRFRLVGGMTYNDTRLDFKSQITQATNATFNGKVVNAPAGSYYNVKAEYAKFAPYLALGWGHHQKPEKGLGFFSEIGVSFGKFKVQSETNLVKAGLLTQADVDAQDKKSNDSLGKLNVLPSVSFGMNYSF